MWRGIFCSKIQFNFFQFTILVIKLRTAKRNNKRKQTSRYVFGKYRLCWSHHNGIQKQKVQVSVNRGVLYIGNILFKQNNLKISERYYITVLARRATIHGHGYGLCFSSVVWLFPKLYASLEAGRSKRTYKI